MPTFAQVENQIIAGGEDIIVTDTLNGSMSRYFILKLKEVDGQYQLDTVSTLYEKYIGELEYLNDPSTPARYISSNPDYFRMFVPYTYYEAPFASISALDWKPQQYTPPIQNLIKEMLPVDTTIVTTKAHIEETVNTTLRNRYISSMRRPVMNEHEINAGGNFSDNIQKEVKSKTGQKVVQMIESSKAKDVHESASVEIHKPNWWYTTGNTTAQMTQNYISDNWYTGGESNMSLFATFSLRAQYNDQEKTIWENALDYRFGIGSTPSDQFHDYLINTDLLTISTKLGFRASKMWYYTISGDAKTQFFHGYQANNQTMISDFLAPLDVNASVGMDYKVTKPKYNLSVFLAPFTWTMRYIGNPDINEVSFGLEQGKCVRHNFGSQIKATVNWTINAKVSYSSTFNYLTSYKWTRIDWENTFNMTVSKYLSTRIYIYPRFDDSAAPRTGHSHLQLKELLSFGFNYKW